MNVKKNKGVISMEVEVENKNKKGEVVTKATIKPLKLTKDDLLYQEEFGSIPNDKMGRISFILGNKVNNEKYNRNIEVDAKAIKRIKWSTKKFTLWKRLRPSARPRVNNSFGFPHIYVPRAKEEGDWFRRYALANNLPIIDTPCILHIVVYEKTPKAWSIKNKVLAELGLIRPWKRTGDFDNYAKGVADFIQHGMLSDDCLIIESTQRLFYSIKPHADIEIKYMDKFPDIKGI